MKTTLSVLLLCTSLQFLHAQYVGINTPTPLAMLHVADSSVLFSAPGGLPATTGKVPVSGAGRRLLWYADKAAFRVGRVTSTQWDTDSIGYYSFAHGYNTKAKGQYAFATGFTTEANGAFSFAAGNNNAATATASTAFGSNNTASGIASFAAGEGVEAVGYGSTALGGGNTSSGQYSLALGGNVVSSGDYSFASGNYSTASGKWSTAMGYSATASGDISVALGYNAAAGGSSSVAMGNVSTASGQYSMASGALVTASGYNAFARGMYATASGDYSVAIGRYISTNGKAGSFFLADSDPYNRGTRIIGTANQMAMRFNGGYYLITSNAAADIGVQIPAGGNSWSVISDVRSKENFLPVDGEEVLKKIAGMPLSTWNYKTQDPKVFRHYGPMAQDFFAAFGKDNLGTIGCDTLINQADFDGVNLIAIQAVENRTRQLQHENEALRQELNGLKEKMEKLERLLVTKQ